MAALEEGRGGAGGERERLLSGSRQRGGESEGDPEFVRESSLTWWSVVVGLAATFASFQYGWAVGAINIPGATVAKDLQLQDGLHGYAWTTVVAIFSVGGLLGAQLAGPVVDRFGRVVFLRWSSLLFIAVGFMQLGAGYLAQKDPKTAFGLMVTSRVLTGIGSGAGSVVCPMYLSEIAPTKFRGMFGATNQLVLTSGILAANLASNWMHSSAQLWAWLFSISGWLGVVQLVASFLLVESPRWLISKGDLTSAIVALRKLRLGAKYDYRCANAELEAIERDIWEARRKGGHGEGGGWSIPPSLLRPFLIMVTLTMGQQLSGINAVFYFSSGFFRDAGVANPDLGTILAGAVNLVATVGAVALIEVAGRRLLLLAGAASMTISAVGLTLMLVYQSTIGEGAGAGAIVFLLLYVIGFEAGLGGIPWMIGGELIPESHRGIAMSYAAALNWLANFAVGLFFEPLQVALTPQLSFVPFIVILALITAFVFFVVPETKNRPIADILDDLGVNSEAALQDTKQSLEKPLLEQDDKIQ